jgi:hypothetical protein
VIVRVPAFILAVLAFVSASATIAAPVNGVPIPQRTAQGSCAAYQLYASFNGSGFNCYKGRPAPAPPGLTGFTGSGGSVSGTGATVRYAAKTDGSLQSFANGVLRITNAGLTAEGASENAVIQSQAYNNASWTNTFSNIAIVDNTTDLNSPDGTHDASRETWTGTNGRIEGQNVVTGDGVTAWTCSIYVHAGTTTTAQLAVWDSSIAGPTIKVTGLGGTPSLTPTGAVNSGSVAGPNGWLEIWVSWVPTNADAYHPVFAPDDVFGSPAPTVGDSAYFYGAQCAPGSKPLSYIPTTTAIVTRSADLAGLTQATPSTPYASASPWVVSYGSGPIVTVQPTSPTLAIGSGATGPWSGLPIQSVSILKQTVAVPAQALAAGMTQLTLDSSTLTAANVDVQSASANCTPGKQWFLANGIEGASGMNSSHVVFNSDGSATIGAPPNIYSGPLTTGGYTSASPYLCGTAYGGGGYFEAAFSYNPNTVNVTIGESWPSWWLASFAHQLSADGFGSDLWPGDASNDEHFGEPDIFEGYVSTTSSFNFTIASNVLTVTGFSGTALAVNTQIVGPGIAAGTHITSLGTGTGGNGTYNLSATPNVSTSTAGFGTTFANVQTATQALHDWYGKLGASTPSCASGYCDGNSGSFNDYTQLPGLQTFSGQIHTAGLLWIPATSTTIANGTLAKYLDGNLIRVIHYTSCPSGYAPPPTGQTWLFCVFDIDRFVVNVGAGQSSPMRVYWAHAWQNPATMNNLRNGD